MEIYQVLAFRPRDCICRRYAFCWGGSLVSLYFLLEYEAGLGSRIIFKLKFGAGFKLKLLAASEEIGRV